MDLVHVGSGGVVVLLVLGVVAVLGGVLRRHLLVLAAGAGLVLAAVAQLALLLFDRNSDWLGGTASTMSLLGGLGLGLLAVGLTNRFTRSQRKDFL